MAKSVIFNFLVVILLLIQLGEYFQWPGFGPNKAFKEQMKEDILASIREELPHLVIDQIGTQIQELAMDKIKLSGMIQEASSQPAQYVLKVGSQMVDKEAFLTKFNEFVKKDEIKNLPRIDQKNEFLKHLKTHYAMLEDCYVTGVDQKSSVRDNYYKYRQSLFLSELLKSQIEPITADDIKKYYVENQALYEVGESFSFSMIEGADQGSLVGITNPESFDANPQSKPVVRNNQPDSQVPFTFRKALQAIEVGELTPVLRYLDKFYLLKKLADSKKIHTRIEDAAPFIQERLTYLRIRNLVGKLANPLKFQFPVSKDGDAYLVNGKPLPSDVLESATAVFPKNFFDQARQSPQEIENVKLELYLIEEKFKKNPRYFPEEVHKNMETLGQSVLEKLLIQEKQKELMEKIRVGDGELKQYYDANKSRFVQQKGQLVAHIFIRDRSRALEILNLAMGEPGAFANLAKQHSEEPRTAPYGGDMRYLGKEDITQELNQVINTLKQGEVHSSILPSAKGDGYHIVQYIREVPTQIASFDEIKDQLSKAILADKRNRYFNEYLVELANKYPIQLDETLFSTL